MQKYSNNFTSNDLIEYILYVKFIQYTDLNVMLLNLILSYRRTFD